jgi:hypothetical protein
MVDYVCVIYDSSCETSGSRGGSIKVTAFWDIAPCSLVEVD